mgnify:CR=1 FL=1
MSSILVVGDERPTGQVAGLALRVVSIVQQLGQSHEVTVMTPNGNELVEGASRAIPLVPRSLEEEINKHDITITRPGLLGFRHLRQFKAADKHLVVDLVVPQPVEGLHYFSQFKEDGFKLYSTAQRRMRRTLLIGDLFLAASEKQRLFWLGAVLSSRCLPPSYITEDPTLEKMVTLAPTGLNLCSALSSKGKKGRLLWGGGLWDWTDPETLVRAAASLQHDELVVHFPGTRHPDARVPSSKNVAIIEELRRDSAVKVELEAGWRSADERVNYLEEAMIGVSLHRAGVEATLSWRFRILDYLWAGLPVIVTAGCPLAELVEKFDAGMVIPPCNVKACAEAIDKLVFDGDCYAKCCQGVLELREELDWQKTLAPLLAFCDSPHKAPDHGSASWFDLVKLALA